MSRISCWVIAGVLGMIILPGCGPKSGPLSANSTVPSESLQGNGVSENATKPQKNVGAKISIDGRFRTFRVYSDASSPDNHFVPTGWMGDFGDIKLNEKCTENPHGGTTCIEVEYSNKVSQGAKWAGIYWQNPPNNWGTRPGGYNLNGAKKLTFWARGKKGGERIEEFKAGGITGEYPDTDVAGIGPAVLTTQWQQFTIDLEGKDLSSISGGFSWATNLEANPAGATFYLDDIKYE